jgi:hypothetical protein
LEKPKSYNDSYGYGFSVEVAQKEPTVVTHMLLYLNYRARYMAAFGENYFRIYVKIPDLFQQPGSRPVTENQQGQAVQSKITTIVLILKAGSSLTNDIMNSQHIN